MTPIPERRSASVEAPAPDLDSLEYLTIEQVAKLLQVTPKALYRIVDADLTFPVLRLGRGPRARLRFPRRRLELWLRQRERGGGQRITRPLRPVSPLEEHHEPNESGAQE